MEISSADHAAEVKPSVSERIVGQLRRRRWFIIFVILPVALATVYYGLIAADVYQSESRFVIKTPSQRQTGPSSIANLIQSTGFSAGYDQTNEVIDYVQSRDALRALEGQVNLRARYGNPDADWLSRYPGPFEDDSFESLFEYYQDMVNVRLDHDTNSAVLTVRAFTPGDAQEVNRRLLYLSEQLVNRLNTRFQNRAVAEAERRLLDAQVRVREARFALREYRNAQDVLDPAEEATGVFEVSNQLIAEQAALIAQLQATQRAAPRNPGIPALRSRIEAVGAQIAAQSGRAVGTDGGLASKLTQFEGLQVEQEFATQMLTAASATLEQARTEAFKQQYYLERVVEPDRPDAPQFPERLRSILVIAGAAIALYLIGWMLIVGILEHAPED